MRSTTIVSLLIAGWALVSREGISFLCEWVELTLFGTRIICCSRYSSSVSSWFGWDKAPVSVGWLQDSKHRADFPILLVFLTLTYLRGSA
jgi:hypothetical protein